MWTISPTYTRTFAIRVDNRLLSTRVRIRTFATRLANVDEHSSFVQMTSRVDRKRMTNVRIRTRSLNRRLSTRMANVPVYVGDIVHTARDKKCMLGFK